MIGDPDSCGFFRVLSSGFLNDPYKDKGFSLRSVVVFFLEALRGVLCIQWGVLLVPLPEASQLRVHTSRRPF
jgi:hypothetical protein